MARIALAAASIALLSLSALTAHAQVGATIVIQSGSPHYQRPAPVLVQYQAPPPPRGMAWAPGHWEWRGHRHMWMQGYWVKARPGYHYREPRWTEPDGRWAMQRGGWDRDRDGVANRHDRDRDGDGVPNRRDYQPGNPRHN